MAKEEYLKKLRELDNIGKPVSPTPKGTNNNKITIGEIEDLVSQMADENRYEIQRIKLYKGGIVYRVCYYTCDADDTHPYYGGKCPIMKETDFFSLMAKAKEKGWF